MKTFFSKLAVISIMFLCAAVFCPQEALAVNMLNNAGFETQLNAWTVGGTTWQSQTGVVYAGNEAAKCMIPNLTNSSYFGSLSQTFTATPGQTFYATAQTKTTISPLASAVAGIEIAFLNGSGSVISYYQDTVGGMTNWQNLYLAKQAPAATAQVRVQVFVFAPQGDTNAVNGSAYFDDVVLDTSYIVPPSQSSLVNPGFENGFNDWVKTEPNFGSNANMKLLLHADGTNGSTTFVDSSASAHAVTSNGGAQIDTAQSVFGGSSASFNGISSYLSVPDSADWDFGTGDFTIDCWVNFNSVSVDSIFLGQYMDPNNRWYFRYSSGNGGLQFYNVDASTTRASYLGTWSPSINTWYHIALVRNGSDFYMFVNGNALILTTYTAISTNSLADLPSFLSVGNYGGATNFLNGHLDELRIVKGTAVWTSNFTPPVAPYSGGTPPSSWTLEQTSPLDGTFSAKNTISLANLDPQATSYYGAVSQEIVATPGQTYYSTVQMKNNISALAQAQGGLVVEFLDVNGNSLDQSGNIIPPGSQSLITTKDFFGNTGGIAKMMYVAATAPTGTNRIRYSCAVWAPLGDTAANGAEVLFDNGVSTTTYIAPPSLSSALQNPGFELGYNHWTSTEPNLVNGTPLTWSLEQGSPLDGTFSAKNTIDMTHLVTWPDSNNPNWDGSYYASVSQEVTATAGQTYYSTLQMKNNISPAAQAQAGFIVEFLDVNGNSLDQSGNIIPPGDPSLITTKDFFGNTAGVAKMMYVAATAPAGTDRIRYTCAVMAPLGDAAANGAEVIFDDGVLTTTYIAPPSSPSVLQNPGFELGYNYWTKTEPYLDSGTPVTWTIDDASPIGQAYSAKNTINMADLDPLATSYYATVSQEIAATQGQMYYATLKAASTIDPTAYAKVGLKLEFLNSSGNVIALPLGTVDADVIGGNTPTRLLYVAVTAPVGTAKVRYNCMVWAPKTDSVANNGTVLFDDAVLTTNPLTPTVVTSLINADCENGINDWDVVEPNLNIPIPPNPPYPPTWQAQDSYIYAGALAARNTINMDLDGSGDYYAALSQTVPITGSIPVYATAMIKTDFSSASSARAGLRVEFYDANDALVGWLPPGNATYAEVGGGSAWQQKIVQGISPVSAVKVKYILYVRAYNNDSLADNGLAYFDDAQMSFMYVNNLSHHPDPYLQNYQYPVELAQNSYYTAPALIRSTIEYLYPDVYFPLLPAVMSQADLYNTYHVGNPGSDFQPIEIKTAMNTELQGIGVSLWGYNPFHYEDWYQTTVQLDAIKNFIYWIDYFVPNPGAAFYCPAFVPVNGNLQWRQVRGFVSDVQPHPGNGSIVPFTVLGFWVNDPTSPGLGYDVYQAPAAFQADYLPVSGQYRSVYEPPLNLNRAVFYKKLEKVNVSLATITSNPHLKTEMTRLDQENSEDFSRPCSLLNAEALEAQSAVLDLSSVFNKDYLREALPKALKHDATFMRLFDKAQSIRQFSVYDKNAQKDYILFALDSSDSAINSDPATVTAEASLSNPSKKMVSQSGLLKTRILLEVDPATGAILEVTWNAQGEIYPRVSKVQAIKDAQIQAGTQGSYAKNLKLPTAGTARLVWSRDFKTSRFHPKWEVVINSQPIVVGIAASKDSLFRIDTISVSSTSNVLPKESAVIEMKPILPQQKQTSFTRNKAGSTAKTK